MSRILDLEDLDRRAQELQARAERLRTELVSIQKELDDLVVVQRVAQRFVKADAKLALKPTSQPVRTKVDMVLGALADAAEAGKEGLAAKDLVAAVQRLYWADAPYNTVVPTASRLVKEARLDKADNLYCLPADELAKVRLSRSVENGEDEPSSEPEGWANGSGHPFALSDPVHGATRPT